MNYLSEAFKKLDFLTEEEFSLQDTAGLDDMDQLLKTPASNIANVIDPEAETEDEACEIAANQISLDEINAYEMKDDGTIVGLN